jgi:hypothetical protein
MKKLVLASLLCGTLAQGGTGCTTTSDPEPGYFNVEWTLTEGADDTPIQGCAEGVTAEVVAENIDTGEQLIDRFDCVNGGGITAAIPAGDYDVWVNVYNGTDVSSSDLIAQSGSQRTAIIDGETVPLTLSFPAGASFELSWTITDDVGPNAQCGDVTADGVSVLSTLVGTDTAFDDVFNCTAMSAVTPQMLLGDYVVSVSLLNGEQSLNEVSTADAVTLQFGNQLVDLGIFDFVLTP